MMLTAPPRERQTARRDEKVEKQGVTLGGGKQLAQRRGRQRAGWKIAGKDTRVFAVTGCDGLYATN